MGVKYFNLLSPLKINDVIIKNRLMSPQSLPHFLQGPETYPADTMITHLSNIAKNGAAIVVCNSWSDVTQRNLKFGDMALFPMFNYSDPSIETYLCQLADAVHFYGSKIAVQLGQAESPNFEAWFEKPSKMTHDMMNIIIGEMVRKAKLFQKFGFDMVSLQMGFRGGSHIGMSTFLSPLSNDRSDEYGGGIENRARFPLEICKRIKEECGKNFLVSVQVIGEEETGGTTVVDTAAFARLAQGIVDILEIRAGNGKLSHPTGFNYTKEAPVTLQAAEAVKKSGAKIVVAPVGGYQDPDLNEEFIRSGKADMISMGRAFICDPNYGQKIYEGRGDDIVPCMRCAKCHVPYISGPWLFMCSANPTAGFAQKINRMVEPPNSSKHIAVIGGGPAGMKAALVAVERGHKVTLYEKEKILGGQLRHADYAAFKWPVRDFKDYLIRQIHKSSAELVLGVKATPEMIEKFKFDAVIVALGAEPNIPDIPGADGTNLWSPVDVFGNEQKMGKRIVVVGGSDIGTETGLYLAECGHQVTVLTRRQMLAYDATLPHYRDMFEDRWKSNGNFSFATEVTTTRITDSDVTCIDKNGIQHTIGADSVVLSGGMKARQDEALRFYGTADRFFTIGDCLEVGNVQKCMRTAFAAASAI